MLLPPELDPTVAICHFIDGTSVAVPLVSCGTVSVVPLAVLYGLSNGGAADPAQGERLAVSGPPEPFTCRDCKLVTEPDEMTDGTGVCYWCRQLQEVTTHNRLVRAIAAAEAVRVAALEPKIMLRPPWTGMVISLAIVVLVVLLVLSLRGLI